MDNLDFSILGREYSVSVKPAERESLLAAVAMVDERLRELASRTNAASETLAVMTALNIAHEMVLQQRGNGLDLPAYKRRIQTMQKRIDGALAPQEKLF
ncbi:cell division protein ZapA [Niveibacterium sp. SC-1]|uniref:cell division protein ZapA n=1 Tax=Niveibacterium sp. SC-1 TaxID=3135646 RepID=UPI00311FEFEF